MSEVQLELPFMMNVLLYINDLQDLNYFLQVSKKCQECSLALRINPLIKFKTDFRFSMSDEEKRKQLVHSFIDKLFIYFPNIQTLQLHHQQLLCLTEIQFKRIDRIRVSLMDYSSTLDLIQKWGSKLTLINTFRSSRYTKSQPSFATTFTNFKKVEILKIPEELVCELILKLHSLKHLIIDFQKNDVWPALKDRLDLLKKAPFKVTIMFSFYHSRNERVIERIKTIVNDTMKEYPSFIFCIKKSRLSADGHPFFVIKKSDEFDRINEIIIKRQEEYNKQYLPFELNINNSFSCDELDLRGFDSLTSLTFLANCKTIYLPTTLKELVINSHYKITPNIKNINELKIRSITTTFETELIQKLTTLEKLDLGRATISFKSPSSLTQLKIKNKIRGYIKLNNGLKQLDIENLPSNLKLPCTLTLLKVPLVPNNGIENCFIKELYLGHLDYLIDSMIPKTVTQLICGEVKSVYLTGSTQLKELMITPFIKKGECYLKNIKIPTSINKLTIWVDQKPNIDLIKIKHKIDKYFGHIDELILDGNFVDEMLSF